jgi:CheY-like chemotaxis protein
MVRRYQRGRQRQYCSNVTSPLLRVHGPAAMLVPRIAISKDEGQYRMTDKFEFAAGEGNEGGNTPQESGPAQGGAVPTTGASGGARSARSSAERRSRRRALISAPVRVRSLDVTEGGPDEISTTLDVSRGGLLFLSSQCTFVQGMEVAVTFPYSKVAGAAQAEQVGRIARVTEMADGRRSVAIALGVGVGEDLVDSSGRKLLGMPEVTACVPEGDAKKPLILVVDAQSLIRDSLKTYLGNDGYEVIAVSNAAEAHAVLKMRTPALLIAEIEGADLPGYELCAHVKSTPRLQTVPVVLLTSSAYPSDYANAHSLGAVVCMAKPYRQERLGHVVRLLAPTLQAKEQTAPPRPADLKRRHCVKSAKNPAPSKSIRSRLRSAW